MKSLSGARAACDADAVLDALPLRAFEPGSVEEVAEIVAASAAENPEAVIVPLGAGNTTGLGRPLERYDLAIRTGRLNRILEYSPEDQVVSVEAGVTLDQLQQLLWRHRQRLAIDPPGGEAMTIGGMLATNAYGPSAHRYGTLKDLIVGIEMVRADGVVARGGGKVVKNVAGFDLPKLLVGSLGTLAIVTKAIFRVHPLPARRRVVEVKVAVEEVFPFVSALRDAQLEPAAVVARSAEPGGRWWEVEVLFEGFAAGVDAQVEDGVVLAACHGEPHVGAPQPHAASGNLIVRGSYPPDAFRSVAQILEPARLFVQAYPARGTFRAHAVVDPGEDFSARLAAVRRALEALGGTLIIERMPRTWYAGIDPWGSPPPAFGLMRALKDRFDPERRFNRGRFVGGL